MKKLIFFIFALLAISSCNKDKLEKGTQFSAGQKVTLCVSPESRNDSKISSNLDGSSIRFAWEDGDEILVTVGTNKSIFKLTGIDEGGRGFFDGNMPAEGSTFNVQYPVEASDLTSQTYSATEPLPKGAMTFVATNQTISPKGERTSFNLTTKYSAIRLNFYGKNFDGESAFNIKKIIVTNTDNNAEYTLNFDEAVPVSTENTDSTSFRIVVPSGTATYKIVVYEPYGTNNFRWIRGFTIPSQTYNVGKVKNMPKKELILTYPETDYSAIPITANDKTVVWAPVNCGYSSTTKYGKYYQFGRKVGGGSSDDAASTRLKESTATTTGRRTKPDSGTFYCSENDWYTTTKSNQLTKWPLVAGDAGYSEGYIQNPCPSGWTVPSRQDLVDLLGGCTYDSGFQTGSHGSLTSVNGRYFNGTDEVKPTTGVFLPAASYIQCNGGTSAYKRGNSLDYWSANVKDNGSSEWNKAYFLRFAKQSGKNTMGPHVTSTDALAYGFSVRCVLD